MAVVDRRWLEDDATTVGSLLKLSSRDPNLWRRRTCVVCRDRLWFWRGGAGAGPRPCRARRRRGARGRLGPRLDVGLERLHAHVDLAGAATFRVHLPPARRRRFWRRRRGTGAAARTRRSAIRPPRGDGRGDAAGPRGIRRRRRARGGAARRACFPALRQLHREPTARVSRFCPSPIDLDYRWPRYERAESHFTVLPPSFARAPLQNPWEAYDL